MNLFELYAKISVDDTNFKKSMENAQKVSKNVATAMQQLQSPLDKAKNTFNAIAHPIETAKANFEKLKNATESLRHPIETLKNKVNDAGTALETKRNKLSVLASGYDSAKKKVADLTKEFNKSAKESGTSSQKTQELAKKLNEAEKEAEEAKKELDDYSASVSKAGKNSDSASKGVGNFASKLGKGLATATKIGAAAVGAAAAGITALTAATVKNYAEYEQLVGGVDTLFKSSSKKVQQYASEAFRTTGMSANEYMSTVTSFSASLLQSLGGDTEKAAEYANQALTDMSDNANKMGTDMSLIQNAYQGFAKQNYTMLDNLKLGYGGTKEEMARLIKDASKLDKSIKANDMSFGNIVKAINAVQTEMGITGTTAKEAGATISGSIGAMKAAWENLVTGLADKNADIGKLVDNLVTTIVGDGTENNLGVLGNIMPAVKRALNGAAKLVEQLFPKIIKEIPQIINENLPILAKSAVGIVESLVKGISKNKKKLTKTATDTIAFLVKSFTKLLPEIIELGLEILISLAEGIAENLEEIVPTIVDVIIKIVNTLTNPQTLNRLFAVGLQIIETLAETLLRDDVLDNLIDAAVQIIISIADFITNNIDKLFNVAVKIIEALLEYLTDPENLAKLSVAAGKIIMSFGKALGSAVEGLSAGVAEVIAWIVKKFTGIDLTEAGKETMKTFIMGMLGVAKVKRTTDIIKSFASEYASGIVSGGIGASNIDGSHMFGLDYVPYDGYIAELHKGERVLTASEARGYGGTSIGNITINIDGAKYSDEQSLASAIALEIQNMTDRRAAVYA